MFKLSIECSKDFDELSIKFSDGKVASFSQAEKTEEKKNQPSLLDSDDSEQPRTFNSPVVQKPQIPDTVREASVASELSEFNI